MNDLTMSASLLAIRAACHFLIFLRVFTFVAEPGVRHKVTIGAAAAAFAGFNLAECVRIAFNFRDFADGSIEPYLPGIMFFVLVFVVWSGGNMARFLPRTIADRLP